MIVEPDPVEFSAAFFAAVHLRVPIVLGNPNWGRMEWERVRQLVNPAVLFGQPPWGGVPGLSGSIPDLLPGRILIPTGGSSGGVKFSVHEWETLLAATDGFRACFGGEPIYACCVLPLHHVSGLMQVVRSFVSGGRIAFSDVSALQAGAIPFSEPGTLCLSLVPTQLQRLLARGGGARELTSARMIALGGASISDSLITQAREAGLPIVLSYGMTETAAMVTALPVSAFLRGSKSAGVPLPHAEVDVVGADGRACPPGGLGRIRVSGRSLFEGYHPITSEKPGSYVTGDEGYFDANGHLHVIGRSDRIIISGGEKIDPLEVETAILNTDYADTAMVLGWPDPEWGQQVVALYTVEDPLVESPDWRAVLREALAHYKIPKRIVRVRSLPCNAQGKVDRARVAAILAAP